ncbi:hypothetical protein Bca4012_084385 [Brassica carinata]
MLQARGRETAVVRLIQILKGTLPVTIRQRQPIPPVVKDLSELQQSDDGEVPLLMLLVTKLIQGPTVVIIDGVLHWLSGGCCLLTGKASTKARIMAKTRIFDIVDRFSLVVVLFFKELVVLGLKCVVFLWLEVSLIVGYVI